MVDPHSSPVGSEIGLRGRAQRAIAWSSVGAVGGQLVQILGSIVISRLLAPEDFGLMAMAVTVSGFGAVLSDIGFGAPLMQRPEVTEEHVNSAFWASIGFAFVGAAVVACLTPLATIFYDRPSIGPLVLVLTSTFVLAALASVPRALITRSLRLGRLTATDLTAAISGSVLGITLAFMNAGVWALVAVQVCSSAVAASVAMCLCGWHPSRSFSGRALRDLLPFTRSMYGYKFINFAIRNGDNMLVGRFLGATQLGIYARAYSLLLLPTRQLSVVIGTTMQVALAKFADDRAKSRRIYLEACQLIAFVAMPSMLLLAITTKPVVALLFGPHWAAAVPTIRIFAIVGILEPITSTLGWIYFAQGRPDLSFRVGLIVGPSALAAIGVGVSFGSAFATGIAYLGASIVLTPVLFKYAGRLIDLTLREMATALAPTLACAVAAAGLAELVYLYASTTSAPVLLQILEPALAASGAYFLLARKADLTGYRLVRAQIARRNTTRPS